MSTAKDLSGLAPPVDGTLKHHYDDSFYSGQIEGSARSAKAYAALLAKVVPLKSVVDVGCGRGAWLRAFREAGAERVVGVDGPWNNQRNMIDGAIQFHMADLNAPIAMLQDERFDLAMTLEVAEHLEERSAETFVESLTRLADVVMFGAAYAGQGGTNHINEQPHTYWATKFIARGFVPYDLFRPHVWGSADIEYWYQQNTFLYVKLGTSTHHALAAMGHQPIQNVAFMDCVHPALYETSHRQNTPTKELVKEIAKRSLPAFVVSRLKELRAR